MISFLFTALAARSDAKMDRLYEVYKWTLYNRTAIDENGVELENAIWDSYNPTAPIKGPWGIKRDGWHWEKAKRDLFIWLALLFAVVETLVGLLLGLPKFLYIVYLLHIFVRKLVFESELKKLRKLISNEYFEKKTW